MSRSKQIFFSRILWQRDIVHFTNKRAAKFKSTVRNKFYQISKIYSLSLLNQTI